MSIQSVAPLEVIKACIDESLSQSPDFMARLAKGGRAALADRELGARDAEHLMHINQALQALGQYEQALVTMFPEALRACVMASLAGKGRAMAASASAVDFDALSLVQENDLAARVELSRVRQMVMNLTETEFALFNIYACSALGLTNVQPDRNPLHPDNYIQALQQVVDATGVAYPLRQLWMQYMGETLGKQLVELYAGLTARLTAAGVKRAGYQVVAMSRRETTQSDSAQAPAAAREVMAHLAGQAEPQTTASMQAIVPDPASKSLPASMPLPASSRGSVAAAVAASTGTVEAELATAPALVPVAPHEPPPVTPPGPAPGQRMTHWLDQWVRELHLANALRDVICGFEPALTQLVQRDDSFFSNAQHPARRLLEDIIRRGRAYPPQEAVRLERFVHFANETRRYLGKLPIMDATAFEHVLRVWSRAWTRSGAAVGTGDPQDLARRHAEEFMQLPAARHASLEMRAFLEGPWAQVVGVTQARKNLQLLGKYLNLVPSLLWSAQPGHTPDDAAHLLPVIQGANVLVHSGLASIEYPPEDIDRILGGLAELQKSLASQAALRA